MKRVFLLCVALASLAFGQNPASEAQRISIEFTVVGWGQEITDLAYRQGGTLKKLEVIPLFKKSKTFRYTGPSTIKFYRQTGTATEPRQDPAEDSAVATVAIPAELKRVMILLSPQAEGYQALVVPDDLNSIPTGQALIMNLATVRLALRANKTTGFALAPGESKLVRPGTKSLLQMEVAYQKGDGWKKSDNFFLPLPSTYQTTILFLHSDSDYFKNVDGAIQNPIQMVVLRERPEDQKRDTKVASDSIR